MAETLSYFLHSVVTTSDTTGTVIQPVHAVTGHFYLDSETTAQCELFF